MWYLHFDVMGLKLLVSSAQGSGRGIHVPKDGGVYKDCNLANQSSLSRRARLSQMLTRDKILWCLVRDQVCGVCGDPLSKTLTLGSQPSWVYNTVGWCNASTHTVNTSHRLGLIVLYASKNLEWFWLHTSTFRKLA